MHAIKSRDREFLSSSVNDTRKKQREKCRRCGNQHLVNVQPGLTSVLNSITRIILLEGADQWEGFTK